MSRRHFEAIIFDLDGTLIDTETADFEACRLLYAELGVSLSLEYWAAKIVGITNGYDELFEELIMVVDSAKYDSHAGSRKVIVLLTSRRLPAGPGHCLRCGLGQPLVKPLQADPLFSSNRHRRPGCPQQTGTRRLLVCRRAIRRSAGRLPGF